VTWEKDFGVRTGYGSKHRRVVHEPVGVVAAITPVERAALRQCRQGRRGTPPGCTLILKPAPNSRAWAPSSGVLAG